MTAITKCGLVTFPEFGELSFEKRFSLRRKGAVYKSYVGLAILHRSEVWFL